MRVKTGFVRRRAHKKIIKANKGFRGTNRRLFKRANEARLHAGAYAFVGRKRRKRDLRKLWIIRLAAAVKQIEPQLNYSRFIARLKKAKIALDRKILADLAVTDSATFKAILDASA
jgi:large subunit ribosomal protein L20